MPPKWGIISCAELLPSWHVASRFPRVLHQCQALIFSAHHRRPGRCGSNLNRQAPKSKPLSGKPVARHVNSPSKWLPKCRQRLRSMATSQRPCRCGRKHPGDLSSTRSAYNLGRFQSCRRPRSGLNRKLPLRHPRFLPRQLPRPPRRQKRYRPRPTIPGRLRPGSNNGPPRSHSLHPERGKIARRSPLVPNRSMAKTGGLTPETADSQRCYRSAEWCAVFQDIAHGVPGSSGLFSYRMCCGEMCSLVKPLCSIVCRYCLI
jgi:hypothetical protein